LRLAVLNFFRIFSISCS